MEFYWYLSIFIAAAAEGEVYYSGAVVAARLGHPIVATLFHRVISIPQLNPIAVLIAGALGGSAGDQAYFYILRSRLSHWLDRFKFVHRRRHQIEARVRSHSSIMILASRFLPGLRIAIPAACAYAEVKALRFSSLSLISGFAWASAIMAVIMFLGPSSLKELGIQAWWAPAIPAVMVVLFFRWLGKVDTKPTSTDL